MREKLLARVKLAAEDDWRASVELLKLSFASDYRRVVQPNQTNQYLHIHGDTHVILSLEQQEPLREQIRRIIATTKGAHVLVGRTPGGEKSEQLEQPVGARIRRQSLLVQPGQQASEVIEPEPEQPEQQRFLANSLVPR